MISEEELDPLWETLRRALIEQRREQLQQGVLLSDLKVIEPVEAKLPGNSLFGIPVTLVLRIENPA